MLQPICHLLSRSERFRLERQSPTGNLTRGIQAPWQGTHNNIAERMHKLIAVGRKNWLFAGSDLGARRNGVIFSLVASCNLHGVDPSGYFRWLLEQLPTRSTDRIGELTPMAFAQLALPNSLAARSNLGAGLQRSSNLGAGLGQPPIVAGQRA